MNTYRSVRVCEVRHTFVLVCALTLAWSLFLMKVMALRLTLVFVATRPVTTLVRRTFDQSVVISILPVLLR